MIVTSDAYAPSKARLLTRTDAEKPWRNVQPGTFGIEHRQWGAADFAVHVCFSRFKRRKSSVVSRSPYVLCFWYVSPIVELSFRHFGLLDSSSQVLK